MLQCCMKLMGCTNFPVEHALCVPQPSHPPPPGAWPTKICLLRAGDICKEVGTRSREWIPSPDKNTVRLRTVLRSHALQSLYAGYMHSSLVLTSVLSNSPKSIILVHILLQYYTHIKRAGVVHTRIWQWWYRTSQAVHVRQYTLSSN